MTDNIIIKVGTEGVSASEAELEKMNAAVKSLPDEHDIKIKYIIDNEYRKALKEQLEERERMEEESSKKIAKKRAEEHKKASSGEGGGVRDRLTTPAALIGGVSSQAIVGVGGAALGAAAALKPLLGLVYGLPQGMLTAGLAAGSLKVSLMGVSEAIKATSGISNNYSYQSAVAMKAAMANLAPEAQKFTTTITSMKGEFDGMRKAAQQGFFTGVNGGLGSLKELFPAIESAVIATATEIGHLIERIGQLTGGGGLSSMLTTSVKLVHDLSDGIVNVVDGLLKIASAGGAGVGGLSKGLVDLTASFDKWATKSAETGKIAHDFQMGADAAKTLFGAVWDLGGALNNILKAATPLGDFMRNGLAEGAKNFKAFTETAGAQAGFTAFFAQIKPLFAAVGDALKEIIKLLATFESSTTGLSGLVVLVGKLAQGLNWAADNIPAFKELVNILLTAATIKWFADLTGISKLKNALTDVELTLVSSEKSTGKFSKSLSSLGTGAVLAGITIGLAVIDKQMNDLNERTQKLSDLMKTGFGDDKNKLASGVDATTGEGYAESFKRRNQNLIQSAKDTNDQLSKINGLNPLNSKQIWETKDQISAMNEQANANQKLIDQFTGLSQATGQSTDITAQWLVKQQEAGHTFDSVDQALKAYNADVDAQGGAAWKAAQGTKAYADQLAVLQTAVDATKVAFGTMQSAQAKITSLQAQAIQIGRSYAASQHGVAQAQLSLANANKALNLTLNPLVPLAFDQQKAALGVTQALIGQQQAAHDLAKINQQLAQSQQQVTKSITGLVDEYSGKTLEFVTEVKGEQRDFIQEGIDRQNAEVGVQSAANATQDAEYALLDARRKGTELDPAVIAGRQAVKDATYALGQAEQSLTDISRDQIGVQEELAKAHAEYAQAAFVYEANLAAVLDNTNVKITDRLKALQELAALTKDPAILAALGATILAKDALGINAAQGIGSRVVQAGRAYGGPVKAGQTYNTREFGSDEYFTPVTDGYVGPPGGGSKDNMSADQIQQIVDAAVSKSKAPVINQTFNEKVDPMAVAHEIGWMLD